MPTKNKLRLISCAVFTAFALIFDEAAAQTNNSFNMEFLGNLNEHNQSGLYSACWGYTAPDGREYALLGAYNGTAIIDITDAPTLTEVAFIPGPNNFWREMKTYQQYAYIVSESGDTATGGVQIVDLSGLPDSAALVKTYIWMEGATPMRRAHTVSIEGKYLYLNGGDYPTGIRILDLTDPVNPVQAGKYVGPYIHDSYIRNDTIYASAIYSGPDAGLDIIDANDKTNPQRIKLLQYPGSGTHNAWTTEDGKYVLTTDEIGDTDKSLKIWDIQNIQNPVQVGEVYSDSAIVHNVFVKDTLAHVAWYNDGIKVVSIADPTNPQVVGYYDTYPAPANPLTYPGAWGAYPYYPSGKVIVSDRQTGLYVLRYTGNEPPPPPPPPIPSRFAVHQNFPNPFNEETTIQFDLPVETVVRARLFNVLGQEIRVLQNGKMPAGEYPVKINARGLPSGIYIFYVETTEFSQSRRMVLVK
ncbi:MAG: choice-of-anchor B family protein [Ignavibacteriae bacterium]|nr:choice-of-anchor B family protein [Ignavibacteriota bacterium]